jgi:hypothetical protein
MIHELHRHSAEKSRKFPNSIFYGGRNDRPNQRRFGIGAGPTYAKFLAMNRPARSNRRSHRPHRMSAPPRAITTDSRTMRI